MKMLTYRFLFILGISYLILIPSTSSAQDNPNTGAGVGINGTLGIQPETPAAGVGVNGLSGIQQPAPTPAPTGGSGATGTLTEEGITNFLTWVAKQAITFVLVIAAIFIMLAGYIYITSLGNTAKVEQAKQMLLYAMIGVLVVLGAYLVVKTFLGQVASP